MTALETLNALFETGCKVATKDDQRDRSQIHISEITGCQRKLWLQLNTEPPEYAIQTMPLVIGSSLHAIFENMVLQTTDNIEVEVPVTFPEYHVIGTADIVDREDSNVIDLKFMSQYGWQKNRDETKFAYIMQVLLYAKALGLEKGTIYSINRGNLQTNTTTWHVDKHESVCIEYLERAKTIYETESMPNRDHPYSNTFECTYCPFRAQCWTVR